MINALIGNLNNNKESQENKIKQELNNIYESLLGKDIHYFFSKLKDQNLNKTQIIEKLKDVIFIPQNKNLMKFEADYKTNINKKQKKDIDYLKTIIDSFDDNPELIINKLEDFIENRKGLKNKEYYSEKLIIVFNKSINILKQYIYMLETTTNKQILRSYLKDQRKIMLEFISQLELYQDETSPYFTSIFNKNIDLIKIFSFFLDTEYTSVQLKQFKFSPSISKTTIKKIKEAKDKFKEHLNIVDSNIKVSDNIYFQYERQEFLNRGPRILNESLNEICVTDLIEQTASAIKPKSEISSNIANSLYNRSNSAPSTAEPKAKIAFNRSTGF